MFKRLFKRFSSDAPERRTMQIRAWCESIDGVTLIEDAEPRSVVRIAGVVESLRIRPREGVPAIEAIVSDGTGSVSAVWLGRRSISGLNLGTRLILQGRLAGDRDRMQMMNPSYEFAAAQ